MAAANRMHSRSVSGGLAATVGLALALGACGSSSSSSASGGGGSNQPKVIVGTGADFVPLSFKDPSNPDKFQGFEIDMIDAIMKHINRDYEFKAFQFSGLIPALQAHQINVVVDDLYIKPEREKVVDFVPYLQSGLSVMVRAGDAGAISSYTDLCGKTVGGLTGSPAEITLLQHQGQACTGAGKPAIKISQYQSVAQELPDLDNGRIDGILEDVISLSYIAKQNNGKYKVAFNDPDVLKSGIAVSKGDSLKGTLQQGFDWFKSSGGYAQDAAKWGVPSTSLLP